MGFRFRRSVRIAKGVRLNFGSRGTSVSVGGQGATVNFSRRGTRTTVGIPGTGIRIPRPRRVAAAASYSSWHCSVQSAAPCSSS